MAQAVEETISKQVSAAEAPNAEEDISLDALVMLINAQRLEQLQDQTQKEFETLKTRQQEVGDLHKLMKSINMATSAEGELDLTSYPEIKNLLEAAKERGVEIDITKGKYTNQERERLIDNIRMTIDDLNVQNDMQLQTISNLTNMRYETYQLARSILKPLHDAKMSQIRGIRGS